MPRFLSVIALSLFGLVSACSLDEDRPAPPLTIGPPGCELRALELAVVEPTGERRPITAKGVVCSVRVDVDSNTTSWDIHPAEPTWLPFRLIIAVPRDVGQPAILTPVAGVDPPKVGAGEAIVDPIVLRGAAPRGSVRVSTASSERSGEGIALDTSFDVTFVPPPTSSASEVHLAGSASLRAR